MGPGQGWLPELGVVEIAAPCAAKWEEMTGDAQLRHCAACELNVYNLSELTADIEWLEETHEVCGERNIRCRGAQDLCFHPVEREKRVAGEPLEIETLGWVAMIGCTARRNDFFPLVIALTPEGGAPSLVERSKRLIPGAQPGAKCLRAFPAVTLLQVAGVFVIDVPRRECAMLAVPLRDSANERRCEFFIDRATRRILLTRAHL